MSTRTLAVLFCLLPAGLLSPGLLPAQTFTTVQVEFPGLPAPGLPGLVFVAYDSMATTGGPLAVTGSTDVGGINDEVLYSGSTLVAQGGDPVLPTGEIVQFFWPLREQQVNSTGELAYLARIALGHFYKEAVFTYRGGSTQLLHYVGETDPLFGPRAYEEFDSTTIRDDGTVFSVVDLDGNMTNDSVILEHTPTQLSVRHREGLPVGGAGPLATATWSGDFTGVLATNQYLLFSGGIGSGRGIYREGPSGVEELYAGQALLTGESYSAPLQSVQQTSLGESGSWAVLGELGEPAPSSFHNQVLVSSFGIAYQVGDPIPGLPAATIGVIRDMAVNSYGDIAVLCDSQGGFQDRVVIVNDRVVASDHYWQLPHLTGPDLSFIADLTWDDDRTVYFRGHYIRAPLDVKTGVFTVAIDTPKTVLDLTCTPTNGALALNWENQETYDSINIYIDGILFTTLPAPVPTTYTTPPFGAGITRVTLEPMLGTETAARRTCRIDNFTEAPQSVTCSPEPTDPQLVTLSWTNPETYSEVHVEVGGASAVVLPGSPTSYTTLVPASLGDTVEFRVLGVGQNYGASEQSACSIELRPFLTCGTLDLTSADVVVEWSSVPGYDTLTLLRNGVPVADQPTINQGRYIDPAVPDGTHVYSLEISFGMQTTLLDCELTVYTGTSDMLLIPDLATGTVGMYSESDGVYLGDLIANNEGLIAEPTDIALGGDGLVYVCDASNDNVLAFTNGGLFVSTFVGPGAAPDGLDEPIGLDFHFESLYVVSSGLASGQTQRINRYDEDGELTSVFVDGGSPATIDPRDVHLLDDGRALVTDAHAPGALDQVLLYESNGLTSQVVLSNLDSPTQVAQTDANTFLVTNSGGGAVLEFDLSGAVLNSAAVPTTAQGAGELANGLWIYGDSDPATGGVFTVDPVTQASVAIRSGVQGGQVARATLNRDFRRGDCNSDGNLNIADPVRTLNFLFPVDGIYPLPCEDACDANDDDTINIADAIFTLVALYPTSCTPGVNCPHWPPPNVGCGPDPTADGLDCQSTINCP